VRVQTRAKPEGFDLSADELPFGQRNPIEYVLSKIEAGEEIDGPLSPRIARIGQQIVDAAFRSAREKRTIAL
jgi:glucose-fructose oxidoreductase